jgi:hypothetical protein
LQIAWAVAKGTGSAVANPIDTARSIGNAVAHPVDTARKVGSFGKAIYQGGKEGIKKWFAAATGDDPAAAGKAWGNGVFSVATTVVPVGNIAKARAITLLGKTQPGQKVLQKGQKIVDVINQAQGGIAGKVRSKTDDATDSAQGSNPSRRSSDDFENIGNEANEPLEHNYVATVDKEGGVHHSDMMRHQREQGGEISYNFDEGAAYVLNGHEDALWTSHNRTGVVGPPLSTPVAHTHSPGHATSRYPGKDDIDGVKRSRLQEGVVHDQGVTIYGPDSKWAMHNADSRNPKKVVDNVTVVPDTDVRISHDAAGNIVLHPEKGDTIPFETHRRVEIDLDGNTKTYKTVGDDPDVRSSLKADQPNSTPQANFIKKA